MDKLLTVVIPTYNMERYLNNTLATLVIEDKEVMNLLEVLVVIDGATDNSSQIAHVYEKNYPNVFRVIDKSNGHYGSCVNAGLKVAKGKYFKILDADDWYDKKALIGTLKALEDIGTDAVFTCFSLVYEDGRAKEMKGDGTLPFNTTLSLKETELPRSYQEMHGLMFLTKLLKDINYRQTEGICYTDTEFVYYPLMSSKTITILPYDLYQYRIGRDEQTISVKSMSKNIKHFEMIADRLIESEFNIEKESYLLNCFKERILYSILYVGILLNYKKVSNPELKKYIDEVFKMPLNWRNELLERKAHGLRFIRIWAQFPELLSNILLYPLRLFYLKKIG